MKLIQITDCHLFADKLGELKGACTFDHLSKVMKCIVEHDRPENIILTGDLSHDQSVLSYQWLVDVVEEHGIQVLFIPGNHDDVEKMNQVFGTSTHFLSDRCLDVDQWRIILLNSTVKGEIWGQLDQDECSFLVHSLESEKNVIIFLHHHPMAIGCAQTDAYMLKNDARFFEIIQPHCKKIKGVFCGHVHVEAMCEQKGVTLWTCPATSVQFSSLSAQRFPGYRVIEWVDDQLVTRVQRVLV